MEMTGSFYRYSATDFCVLRPSVRAGGLPWGSLHLGEGCVLCAWPSQMTIRVSGHSEVPLKDLLPPWATSCGLSHGR